MQSEVTQYGRLSVYVFDVLLVGYLAVVLPVVVQQTRRWMDLSFVRRAALGCFGALVVWSVGSIFWSLEPRVAIVAAGHLLLAVGLFTAIVLDRDASPDVILAGIALGMMVPSLFGWIQSATQSIGASTLLGIAAQDPAVLGTAVIEQTQGRWLRAYGSFPHPNIFGGFLAVGLVAVLGVIGRARMQMSETLLWCATVVIAGALILTASRGAWLAALLGVVVLLIGSRINNDRLFLQRLKKPVTIALVVMTIMVVSLGSILLTRFDVTNRLETQSVIERVDQWGDVGTLATQNISSFVGGAGIGNMVFALEERQPLLHAWTYQPAHNVFGLVLVELGALGLLLLIGLIAMTNWYLPRYWRHTSVLLACSLGITVLALACVDHYLWTQPSGLYLLAICLAVILRLGEEARSH